MKIKPWLTWKRVLLIILVILLIFIVRPLGHLIYTYFSDDAPVTVVIPKQVNDASMLNATRIDSLVLIPDDSSLAVTAIIDMIGYAKRSGKKISIAGAQHSMGGHTIYPDGVVLDMKGFHYMQLDTNTNILHVGSGALWSQIIPYLDKHRRSVAVMQSNNSFSVGGSVSVNCHGWQPNVPPIASTVESFRLINAEGKIINCSRSENTELFSLVPGGYGLFGVILDLNIHVVPNRLYIAKQYIIASEHYIREFNRLVLDKPAIGMVYGRININPDHFMEEAIISTYTIDTNAAVPPLGHTSLAGLRRTVFRGSANSDYGKNLRWKAEKFSTTQVNGRKFTRNQLLNEGVEVFQNTDTAYTDILHEYFIPKDSVIHFIEAMKSVLTRYKVDLLNITVRNVKKDDDTFLKYANEEVFGFVMLYNQSRTAEAEKEMTALTRELIDTAIALKGNYYLPYRLHASREQMHQAYPQAMDFFELKKKYDSFEIFQNNFYKTYK